ncbi:MAG: hypothetical protein QOF38_2809 [Pseudonocardiales bacterium]|nr:hypothetical protein [Pseudonocardiales bacterium]
MSRPAAATDTADTAAGASARTLRPLIVALLIVLGLNLAFAVLTIVFQDRILDYQVAADPGFGQLDATAQTRHRFFLGLTLWTRPAMLVAALVIYLSVIRGLRDGRRGPYLRVRLLAAVLLALHSYLLAAHEYPPWLRFIEGAQVVALIVLLVIARRPAIRSVYARDAATPDPDPGRPRTGREITCLIVLTPLIAELAWGSTRFSEAWALPLFGPAYAGAALLIRETVRRRGLGWGSVLLFGTAYGLAEEGLALQSLTSTGMYPVAGWAPRVAGINTAYTLMVLPYHAVFSIALPILMVDLLFPRHRSSPYLRTRGLICSALALILGLCLMRLVAAFNDPGYQVPLPYAAAIVGLIAGCVGLALRRPAPSAAPTRRTLPTPAVIALCAGAAVALYLGLLIPMPGATHSAYTEGHQQWLPLLAVPAAAAAATLAVRPFARVDWTNAQRAALLGGALVAHTAIGLLTYPHTTTDRVGLAALGLLEAATAVLLVRQNRAAWCPD